jgi:hypothetical protein
MDAVCTTFGTNEKCMYILVRKSEGEKPLEIIWSRLEDNIKIDLKQISMRA